MVEQLEAILDRIGRAEEHLDSIKTALRSYYEADGCHVRAEHDPDVQGDIRDDEVIVRKIDPRINTLIGEVLHDLRSVLDHLAWQLVADAGGTPTDKTHFPIWDAPRTDKNGERRDAKIPGRVSAAAQTLVGASQPYQRGAQYGEHPLWLLHQLWNIDKHRHVIAKGIHTAITFPYFAPRFRFTTRLLHATEHGAKLVVVPDSPDMEVEAHTIAQIAIYEPEYGIERPLLRTLEEAHEAVDALIGMAEATCFAA